MNRVTAGAPSPAWIALLGLLGCDPDVVPEPAATGCNGADALCLRRLDEVAFATTHNAMSSAERGWTFPNQEHAVPRQLDDGIRGLVLDTHYADDEVTPMLCHGFCALGNQPLVDGLAEVAAWLDAHPREVVVVIFEAYVSEADTAAAFAASGLDRHVYAPASGPAGPWPTLGTLIEADTRLVVFTSDTAATLPWHTYAYDAMWENPYAARTPEELSCAPDRGDPALPLWALNHFLTDPVADLELAAEVNANPFFEDRVRACMDEASDFPNFVLVDFYATGDLIDVVAGLNGDAMEGDAGS